MKTKAFASLLLLVGMSVAGDVVIDDFNTSQNYPECCGAYGAYDSFVGNVVQTQNS
jgi:hypothetical protein